MASSPRQAQYLLGGTPELTMQGMISTFRHQGEAQMEMLRTEGNTEWLEGMGYWDEMLNFVKCLMERKQDWCHGFLSFSARTASVSLKYS